MNMKVWELVQELMQYKPDDDVVIEVTGDCVHGELISTSGDKSEGCISLDKFSSKYDVVPLSTDRAVIEVDI